MPIKQLKTFALKRLLLHPMLPRPTLVLRLTHLIPSSVYKLYVSPDLVHFISSGTNGYTWNFVKVQPLDDHGDPVGTTNDGK